MRAPFGQNGVAAPLAAGCGAGWDAPTWAEADFAANKIRAVQRDAFLGYLSVTEQRSAGSQQGYQVAGDGAADGVQCRGNGPAVGDGANLLDPVRAVGRDDGHVGVPCGELVGSGGAAHDADRGDVMASGDGGKESAHRRVGGVVDDDAVEPD